jgi:hypothetical protein
LQRRTFDPSGDVIFRDDAQVRSLDEDHARFVTNVARQPSSRRTMLEDRVDSPLMSLIQELKILKPRTRRVTLGERVEFH